MGVIRILIGLLLVILPTTQSRSTEIRVVRSEGLQQSQVAASEVKENLYWEFALVETQEKATDITTDDGDNQTFTGLLNLFFGVHNLEDLPGAKSCITQAGHSLAIFAAIPRYILYHCLIIPF